MYLLDDSDPASILAAREERVLFEEFIEGFQKSFSKYSTGRGSSAERDIEIASLVIGVGERKSHVAREFGLSTGRIDQICKEVQRRIENNQLIWTIWEDRQNH